MVNTEWLYSMVTIEVVVCGHHAEVELKGHLIVVILCGYYVKVVV